MTTSPSPRYTTNPALPIRRRLQRVMMMAVLGGTVLAGTTVLSAAASPNAAHAADDCGEGYEKGSDGRLQASKTVTKADRSATASFNGLVRYCDKVGKGAPHNPRPVWQNRRVLISYPEQVVAVGSFRGLGVRKVCIAMRTTVRTSASSADISVSFPAGVSITPTKSNGNVSWTFKTCQSLPSAVNRIVLSGEQLTVTLKSGKIDGVEVTATAQLDYVVGSTRYSFTSTASDYDSSTVGRDVEPEVKNQEPVAQGNTMGFTFRPADPIGTQKCNSINVLTNDSDPDGDPLTAVATGANFTNNAPSGTYYTLQPDGTFSICVTRGAANNFGPTNPLTVTYAATDSKGGQSQPVNVVITPSLVNAAPTAVGNSMGFTFRPADPIGTQKCNSINVLANDSDPDGDVLTAVATGANFTNNAPAGTYYTLESNGTFGICVTRGAANSFSPSNPLVVTYVATDQGAQSQPVNVVITPSLVNSAPTAGANSMGFTFRAADPVGTQKCNAINVLTNDGDPDGDPLAAVATGANFNNNAPNGTYYTMQPNGTFSICVTRGAANSFSAANPLLVSYVAADNQGAQSQPVNIFITPSLV